MGDYLTRSNGQQIRQHWKMAYTTMETKTEALMVKLISSINQILLLHCFVMMISNFFETETEADYQYQEGDHDERTLMDRADSVFILLPTLSALAMGFLAVTEGRKYVDVDAGYTSRVIGGIGGWSDLLQ